MTREKSKNNKLNRSDWIAIISVFLAFLFTIYNSEIDEGFSWNILISGYYTKVFWIIVILTTVFFLLRKLKYSKNFFSNNLNRFVLNQIYFSSLLIIILFVLDSIIFNLTFIYENQVITNTSNCSIAYSLCTLLTIAVINTILFYQEKIKI